MFVDGTIHQKVEASQNNLLNRFRDHTVARDREVPGVKKAGCGIPAATARGQKNNLFYRQLRIPDTGKNVSDSRIVHGNKVIGDPEFGLFSILTFYHVGKSVESNGAGDGRGKHDGEGCIKKTGVKAGDVTVEFTVNRFDADNWLQSAMHCKYLLLE